MAERKFFRKNGKWVAAAALSVILLLLYLTYALSAGDTEAKRSGGEKEAEKRSMPAASLSEEGRERERLSVECWTELI